MINEFVTVFEQNKEAIQKDLLSILVSYHDLYWKDISILTVVKVLAKYLPEVDPERIAVVDWGDYQGTQVIVLGEKGYQPDKHWAVSYGYGSCSGCDVLQDACYKRDISQLMLIVLHLVQKLKQV
jgi:hypothetical protein